MACGVTAGDEVILPALSFVATAHAPLLLGAKVRLCSVIGQDVQGVLLGGPEVDSAALLRFYVLHVAVLPLALVGVLTIHLWRWRKDSMLAMDTVEGGDDA